MEKALIGITMGDPAGVGPEIIVKALANNPLLRSRCVVYGAIAILDHYIQTFDYKVALQLVNTPGEGDPYALRVIQPMPLAMNRFIIGKTSPVCGDIAFHCLASSVEDALNKKIGAIVTAPLNKEAMNSAGHHYDGHTGALAYLTGCSRVAMFLWSDLLKVIHVTTHVSMRQACDLIKKDRVIQTIELAHETLLRAGYRKPRIAVAGLNAHAGENGLFGTEELTEIIPAIEKCQLNGICADGPFPPDTVFLKCKKGIYDAVVAMYHDQGHIPLKLLDFQGGVNLSAGLPILRTSVDHGTAFDIAGKGIASEKSLLQAIEVADLLLGTN